jgi:hypothetical protein
MVGNLFGSKRFPCSYAMLEIFAKGWLNLERVEFVMLLLGSLVYNYDHFIIH